MTPQFNLTADGSGAPINFTGEASVIAQGTFGGGTLVLEASYDDGTTWIAITDKAGSAISISANTIVNIQLYGKCRIRPTLSGATSPDVDIIIA